ncbi:MAG TPA: DNA cytosine methyltransferase [Pyrinomonadaceae bacterium]|nr:DNA cytosine methyltransferase [Pyrinomonadaceae bacterium]
MTQTRTVATQSPRKPKRTISKPVVPSTGQTPVISYFTGGGFLDLGFLSHGFKVVWRNENNPAFADAYEHGMAALLGQKDEHVIKNRSSILSIPCKQVLKEAFHNTGKPQTFGVIGGPPCSDFANGGKHKGGKGQNGMLTKVFVDHILEIQPSFFLLENVKGLFQIHRPFLNRLIAKLNIRYDTSLKLLDALDYGVPQSRERMFLVGFEKRWLKNSLAIDEDLNGNGMWFPWRRKNHRDAKNAYAWPGQDPFGGSPEKPAGIPEKLMVGTWICDPQLDVTTLPNGLDQFVAKSTKFHRINEGDDSRKSFKRLHRWRYSPTAAYGKNEVHLHPIHPRRLSVREVMRIQTIPDEYVLPEKMSLSHKFRLVSNGVPVKLAEAVAASFVKVVDEHSLKLPEKHQRK